MTGSQCCMNPPVLSSSCGEGCVVELGGLRSYVSGSPASKIGIILISDVFGYEAPNLRRLADNVAASGFYVVVPDFFHGDPLSLDNAKKPLRVWIHLHRWEKGVEEAKFVIEDLKSRGICPIGAAGFCWGAKVVVELAKSNYIQAAVLVHPSIVTLDDMKDVQVPIAILGAEVDKHFPIELLKQCEDILASKSEVKSFVKMFPGTAHGWAMRYKDEERDAVAKAEEAHQDMLAWLTKYVKDSSRTTTTYRNRCNL